MSDFGIYIHIPFCHTRCGYCDFNAYAGLNSMIPEYVRSLCMEIGSVAGRSNRKITARSVYFGGGTPSVLPVSEIERIMTEVRDNIFLLPEAEITIEANPGSVTREYLSDLHSIGVNRLSLGMQSASPEELALLERNHSVGDVIDAVSSAREAGFENLSLDLIFGLPAQTLQDWRSSLNFAVRLTPEHLSIYGLILEEGTAMNTWVNRGLLCDPDDGEAGDMYEYTVEYLNQKGYLQYEISNWERADQGAGEWKCQHNLNYWRMGPYLGFGAGAHGYDGDMRIANESHPLRYIQRMKKTLGEARKLVFPRSPATVEIETLDKRTKMSEFMFMGLRLVQEGVSQTEFKARFGDDLVKIYAGEIEGLLRYGLIETSGADRDRIRLTSRGRLLANQVFLKFI